MHQLITIVGSLMIMALFVCQFAADESTYLRIIQIDNMINDVTNEAVAEAKYEKTMDKLVDDISKLPETEAVRKGETLTITLDGVIGVKDIIKDEENRIIIERKLNQKLNSKDEKSDNDNWNADTDDNASQISAASNSDCY